MDNDLLKIAFTAHMQEAPRNTAAGKKIFTRRIVIALADMFDLPVKTLVLRCENLGLCKRGSWDWFQYNGGFTKEHFEEARKSSTKGTAQ